MPEITDEAIAAKVQAGDRRAFGDLMQRYDAKLQRYIKKFLFGYDETEDLVQETFIRAYVNIQGFDTTRKFSPWIYRIAHNLCINAIKKKGKESLPFFDPDTLFPHPIEPRSADSDIHDEELRIMLDRCLEHIQPTYREILILFYFQEISYQEISDVLKIPMSTVGVRLRRARLALKKIYVSLYGENL